MSRYVDAEKIDFNEVFKGQSDFARDTREAAQSLIDKQPTADVEEVVRCKDCLFMIYQFGVGDNILGCRRNGLNMIDGNGYCAWAQKMDREVCE